MLMCLNYFYVGKLVGVNRTCLKLEDVSVVYETGEWGAPKWKERCRSGVNIGTYAPGA